MHIQYIYCSIIFESGKTIYSFRSVPYGKPPVGDRRFRRSEPNDAWVGVRDATVESPKSLQPNILFPELLMLREGSEDCLYINVYTKNVQMEGELPIEKVFKIHFENVLSFCF